ncbi:MAG: hypothetical protein A2061_08065 [Gallionellales bacterium GWA2_59_43]|nr:MAG: hypothetical protein A2061_08065 [Gallionellales bacterium GWA2_59_43]
MQKEATVAAAVSKPVAKKAASGQRKDIRQTEATSAAHSPEQRYRMVEMAAYFIAERNGFQGDAAGHWQVAELEIAQLLDA